MGLQTPLAEDREDGRDEVGVDVAGFIVQVCPAVEAEGPGLGLGTVAGEDELVGLVPGGCFFQSEKGISISSSSLKPNHFS